MEKADVRSHYIPVLERTISRSTHCRGIHPKSFWFAYSWGMSLFCSHSISLTLCREPAKKHFYPLILTLFTVLLQFHNFFADENIGAQKYHFEFLIVFFKCVAISHPLNPGATPWYFTSLLCKSIKHQTENPSISTVSPDQTFQRS